MFGPYGVTRQHPNSFVEAESLTIMWRDGVLSITYISHETPDEDGPFYLAEWQVRCPEPELVREQRHRSANLLGDVDDMPRGTQP
jgi:hypothetical protein